MNLRHVMFIFLSVGLALVAALIVFLVQSRSTGQRPAVAVSFAGYATNDLGQGLALFKIANLVRSRVVCYSFVAQFKSRQNETIDLHYQFTLKQDGSHIVAFPPPVGPAPWRMGLFEYSEDWRNRLKMNLGATSWGVRFIPARYRVLSSDVAWSDWLPYEPVTKVSLSNALPGS